LFAYWLMFGIYAIGGVLSAEVRRMRPTASPLFIAAALLTICWMGFRYQTGGDWYNYLDMFAEYGNKDFGYTFTSARGDPAFAILNWLAAQIGAEVWVVNLVSAILMIWGIVRFSKDQPNPWLVVCVAIPYLIIVVGMGYVRQGVAIGLILAAIPAFGRRKYIQFIVLAALATAFHKSALIIVPIIVLSEARYKFTVYGIGMAMAAVLFAAFIDSFLDRLLTNYVDAELSSSGTGIRVAMNMLPAVVFLIFRRRFTVSEQEIKLWTFYSLASIGCVIAFVISPSSTAVDRIALYLIPLQLFVLGRLPYAFPGARGPDKVLLFSVIVYSAAIQFVWLNYAENSHWWIPYRTYLATD
jgi:hypothetical protein